MVYASVDLRDGALGAAPAQGGPSRELAWVLGDDAGKVVVNAGSLVVGFIAAQKLRAGHTVAKHRHADSQVFHIPELGVRVGVDQRRSVPVPALAAHEVGAAFQYALGQRAPPRQMLQVIKINQVAVDINAHCAPPEIAVSPGFGWLGIVIGG